MRSLNGCDSTKKAEVLLLPRAEVIQAQVNAVTDGASARHFLAMPLKVADCYVLDFGEELVKLAQPINMRVVNGVHKAAIYEPGLGQSGNVVQVNDIAIAGRVGD